MGLKEDQLTAGEQLSDPDTGILTYLFTGTGKEKARKALITVQGGYPLYFTQSAAGAASKYSVEEILRRAGEWVSSQGFTGMQQSFFRIQDNLCTIWFHYYEGGVICYPDEIQVIVSMDSCSNGVAGSRAKHTTPESTSRPLPITPTPRTSARATLSIEANIASAWWKRDMPPSRGAASPS